MKSRNKYLLFNSIASFIQQVVTVISGLILPQLMLRTYGVGVNGAVASIGQFISITSLFQGGITMAARVAFYHPVATGDWKQASVVYKESNRFFRKFALALSCYIIVLAIVFPMVVETPMSYSELMALTLIIGFSAVIEYVFGATNVLLLFADQKGFINTGLQMLHVIISTIVSIILIKVGASVLVVKFVTILILLIRPYILALVVKKNYNIDKNVPGDKNAISQNKEATSKSIAYFVHTTTDTMVITACMNVIWVSIYTVHKYVVGSISTLVATILGNTEVVFGQMIAKNENEEIENEVPVYDLLSKMLSTNFFFTCIILITKFIDMYSTGNKEGVSFHYPVFAVVYCLGEMVYCMSLTYNNMIMAAGHIKQTQWISYCEAGMNLILSFILVSKLGIIGVAIGTLAAFIFNSVANIIYMRKHIYKMPLLFIAMSYLVNIGAGLIAAGLFHFVLPQSFHGYIDFLLYAAVVFAGVVVVDLLMNMLFFRRYFGKVIGKVKSKFVKS